MRLPPDIAPLLELYRDLGEAARRGLHVAEQRARRGVEDAAARAAALTRFLRRGTP